MRIYLAKSSWARCSLYPFFYDDAIVEFEEAMAAGADSNLVIDYYANSLLMQKQFQDVTLLSDRGLTARNKALLTSKSF